MYSRKKSDIMKIQKVTPDDLNEIYKLEEEVFGEDAFSMDLIMKLILSDNLFLKLVKGLFKREIIAFGIATKDRKNQVNIINFLVKPKFQKKGYGSKLLQELIQNIKELRKIKKIVLNVKSSNEIAIKLYEKYNFKIVEKIENYYQSGDDSFLMEMNI